MFSSTMEVDCCLEEFAKVLVANGYMNEDSCFNDADIPLMLNAFETPNVLDSQDTFPASMCSYGDLSRSLEMAQIANQNLLDSCLSDVSHLKPASCDFYPVRSQNSYVGHSVANDSGPHMATSFKGSICSKDLFLHNVNERHVNMTLNTVNRKQEDVITSSNIQGSTHVLLPHPLANLPETNSCPLLTLRENSPEYHVYPSGNVQQQPSLYTELSRASNDSSGQTSVSGASNDSSGQTSADIFSSRPKQKRKRRSKGYSKATKSKKKKTKEFTETKSQSKPKKQKLTKDSVQKQLEAAEAERSSLDGREDIPHEDSGFESGDGKMVNSSDSSTVVGLGAVHAAENSESVADPGPNKSLRRSSRTTRNPENYNFRLSSLVKRVETERRQQEPRQPKDKSKPPPLSKYRRRTANARERDRMKEINDAFDTLRSSLPTIQRDDGKNKITKFTILKHALNYIASLRDILGLETVSSLFDDDTNYDFSPIQPGSVASSGAEDSCSSPTSGHSMTNPLSSQHVPVISDTPSMHNQSPGIEFTHQGILPSISSAL